MLQLKVVFSHQGLERWRPESSLFLWSLHWPVKQEETWIQVGQPLLFIQFQIILHLTLWQIIIFLGLILFHCFLVALSRFAEEARLMESVSVCPSVHPSIRPSIQMSRPPPPPQDPAISQPFWKLWTCNQNRHILRGVMQLFSLTFFCVTHQFVARSQKLVFPIFALSGSILYILAEILHKGAVFVWDNFY